MMTRFLASFLCWYLWVGGGMTLSLPPQTTVKKYSTTPVHDNIIRKEPPETTPTIFSRRHTLATVIATVSALLIAPFSKSHASPLIPDPQAITSVVLDSPDSQKIGVELYNVQIGNNSIQTFPAVKAVQPEGAAASANVEPGMIVLGNFPEASKSVVTRIQKGPYPIVLQFYNLAKVGGGDSPKATTSPQQALLAAQQASQEAAVVKEPPLSAKGTGLVVKTVQKPTGSCRDKARRGDTLEINYEARVASPGGPLYDSSQERGQSVSFVVGSGEVVNGVDIGVYDMCPGEIRVMDIPTNLGYGRAGSEVFDIPGDVRLWWRVEVLKVTKKGT